MEFVQFHVCFCVFDVCPPFLYSWRISIHVQRWINFVLLLINGQYMLHLRMICVIRDNISVLWSIQISRKECFTDSSKNHIKLSMSHQQIAVIFICFLSIISRMPTNDSSLLIMQKFYFLENRLVRYRVVKLFLFSKKSLSPFRKIRELFEKNYYFS